jgi:hypothetical protein
VELINATRMIAGYTMGVEPSGRELLVVVVKGTFALPKLGEQVRLHDEQVPLVMADTFTGEPGSSAPMYEVDFAPRKHACDVLLLGSAYAPAGRAVTRRQVGLHIGPIDKICGVVGDRVWEAGLGGIRTSQAQRFERMPLSYDRAFGGVDQASDDPSEHDAYLCNPVGLGYHKQLKAAWVDGKPLPNIEAPGQMVSAPTGRYAPMAFGPVGRGWAQRACHAGTYDQAWLDNECPFLPRDFDERYYQAAPADQQLPIPQSPLDITLTGLTPDGLRHFTLPHFSAPVHVFAKKGAREDCVASLDTIVLEPDHERFTLTWRMTRPLERDMFELAQVLVGWRQRTWWASREQVIMPGSDAALDLQTAVGPP